MIGPCVKGSTSSSQVKYWSQFQELLKPIFAIGLGESSRQRNKAHYVSLPRAIPYELGMVLTSMQTFPFHFGDYVTNC